MDLILCLPVSYNNEFKTATEWAKILPHTVPEDNVELRPNAVRPGWVRYQFTSNVRTLSNCTGMVVKQRVNAQKNKVNVYAFTMCAGKEPLLSDDETGENGESSTTASRGHDHEEVL